MKKKFSEKSTKKFYVKMSSKMNLEGNYRVTFNWVNICFHYVLNIDV